MRSEKGVTLIELLIAVSLVSFLSLGMMLAMRVGLNAMEKTDSRFRQNRKALGVQKIIQSQIAGLIPVAAVYQLGGGAPPIPFLMFEGRPDRLRFVSTYSLAEAGRGYPRLLEFKVIPGERNEGVRLVVNERLYGGPAMAGSLASGFVATPQGALIAQFPDVEVGSSSFVLADKLAYCRLSYRQILPPPDLEVWLSPWLIPDRLPSGIRVEMAPLAPDGSRLPVMTVNALIHIDKVGLGQYAD